MTPPRRDPVTNIYFIRCGWLVKIGYSCEINARVWEIDYPSPAEKEIAGVIPNVHRLYERRLHDQLKDERVFGEWFVWTDRIADFVERQTFFVPNDPLRGNPKLTA